MAESSIPPQSAAIPSLGIAGERTGKPIADALRKANRAAIESAMGKQDSWCRKIINCESGVTIDDIDALLDALGKKAVSKDRRCVDPTIYDAVLAIHERLAPNIRQLVWDDSE